MKNINMTLEECTDTLVELIDKLGFSHIIQNNKNNSPMRIFHIIDKKRKGMLRIYVTSKGLTLDKSAGKDKGLNEIVYEAFKNYKPIEKVENKSVLYKRLPQAHIKILKELILSYFSPNNGYTIDEDTKLNELYRLKIVDTETRETVTVIQYSNSNLQVIGLRYNLWEDICYLIEKEIEPPISEIINRFISDDTAPKCDENNSGNIDKNRNYIIELLSEEVASYLYSYDLDVLISAQCILDSGIRLPDYCAVLSPALKATEGFTKKILIDLGIVEKIKMKSNWRFNVAFDKECSLKEEFHNKLNKNSTKRTRQLELLSQLCSQMWNLRNPLNHSGPKPPMVISDFLDCKDRFEKNLDLIKNSYEGIMA